jgi:hypothetical protein
MGNDAGLAAARSRQDQERAVAVQNGFALRLGERCQKGIQWVSPSGGI